MSDFYGEIAATADEILREFGAASTLTRTVPGTYDPATGGTTPDATTVYPCTMASFPIDDKWIDGTRILTGDEEAYLSVIGLGDPLPGDKIPWRGATYAVVNAKVLAPAGQAVLYTLQLRK